MFDYETLINLFYLVCGLAFFLIGGLTPILNRRTNRLLPWTWLGAFACSRGIYELLSLPALQQVMGGNFEMVRLAVLFLSVIFLLEFARAGSITSEGPIPRWWIYILLAGLVILLANVVGLKGLFETVYFSLILVGGLWAAWVLFQAAPNLPKGKEYLIGAAIFMVLYPFASCIVDNPSAAAPVSSLISGAFLATVGVPIQLARAVVAIGLAFSLFRLYQTVPDRAMDRNAQKLYQRLTAGTVMGLAFIAAVGIVGSVEVNYLASRVARDTLAKNQRAVQRIKEIIDNEMEKADRLVQLLAGSIRVYDALTGNDMAQLARAGEILDRYSQIEEGFSVCYIMDLQGTTIASSNRNQPDSFVGKNYGFRPYFKQAVLGMQGRYFALGVTSKELGYYTSCPVRNIRGAVVGVAVIKRAIRTVGELKNAFVPGSATFLVDPHGIVVLSNQVKDVLRSLWPMNEETTKELITSAQFGPGPFPAILNQTPVDGKEYQLGGQRMMTQTQPTLMEGWTLFQFGSVQPIALYRLMGVGVILAFGLALIGFYVTWDLEAYKTARIAVAEKPIEGLIGQGELKYQMLGTNIGLLGEMGDLLQGCKSSQDAIPVISRYMQRLFPDFSGGIYLSSGSGNNFAVAGVWGDAPPEEQAFVRDDCWALRRGRQYLVDDPGTALLCHHLPEDLPDSYQCWPIAAQGETLGVFHLRQDQHNPGNLSGAISAEQKQVTQQLLTTVVDQIALVLINLKLRETART